MARERAIPRSPATPALNEGEYTFDPDLLESDRTLGRAPISTDEEAGAKPGTPAEAHLIPCAQCGQTLLWGQTVTGQLVSVDPEVLTYIVVWQARAAHPTLLASRGYPEHVCPKERTP